MQETVFIPVIFIGAIVAFIAFWLGIVYMISRIGGWAGLAEQFPATGRIQGSVYRFCSARLKFMTSYSNCMTVIVSPSGLYMEPMILFRFGHSPILIPRRAIVDYDVGSLPFFRSVRLTIQKPNSAQTISVRLYGRGLSDELEQWLGGPQLSGRI
ncbi:MAG: hypothetical protein GKR97_02350 [Rhizobiaceae bacterium]|nr:hypothetical protein [Rhizobiaceae bacterium]